MFDPRRLGQRIGVFWVAADELNDEYEVSGWCEGEVRERGKENALGRARGLGRMHGDIL